MSLAPDWTVPENVSPFVPLPLLTRCTDCLTPLTSLEEHSVVVDGCAVRGLCRDCAVSRAGD